MVRSGNTTYHNHRRKNKNKVSKTKRFDDLVFTLSFLQPLSGLPQAMSIWQGSGEASLLTWVMFTLFGFIMLAYGIVHRIWPIIIGNIIWTVIDIVIIVGIIYHS